MSMFLILINCKKVDEKNVPVLNTNGVSKITETTATCGGCITSDGGATITAKGVCWCIGQTPSIANNKTIDGKGAGRYTSALTGLSPDTIYNVRAYATNSAGTGYGNTVSFTAQKGNDGTVSDFDGNVYHTVTIGSQVWMVENLKVAHYRNGSPISNITDPTEWTNPVGGACCDYDNVPGNSTTYGKLYNWYAIYDTRKLAPDGWRVPDKDDWTTLITNLGDASVAGGKLKEKDTAHWQSPNTEATNISGFTALPGGQRDGFGEFLNMGIYGNWWSSSDELPDGFAWYWSMSFYEGSVGQNNDYKLCGFSVRCLKN